MRTTLNVDDDLMSKAKRRARESGRTVTRVIEDALRRELAGEPAKRARFRLRWVTVTGERQPGVDVTDRDALYEKMEGRS